MLKREIPFVIFGTLFLAVLAIAAGPQTISYQGYLTGATGAPATGPVSMTFSLYSSNPARNNPVWRETQPVVTLTNGIYSTRLGSVAPIAAPFDVPYWLGVKVGSDLEMSLQPLSSVPYALRASSADTIPASAIALGSITGQMIAAKTITADRMAAGVLQTWQNAPNSTAAAPNTGYVASSTTPVAIELPANPNIGDIISVTGAGSGGWSVTTSGSTSIQSGINSSLIPAGNNWTVHEAPSSWYSIAASDDGSKLIAVEKGFDGTGGYIHTSTDRGSTWTQRGPKSWWQSVASSSDGTRLVATTYNDGIYTSTDSGATWQRTWSIAAANHISVASSSDGTKLVVATNGGTLYTSIDSGTTWIPREAARQWSSVASSSNGTKLVAAAYNDNLYTSSDSGATWTPRESIRNWSSVASSSDGTRLAAVAQNGSIYTSTDSGATWTERTGAGSNSWASVAMSANGSKILASALNQTLALSTDGGATWAIKTDSGGQSLYAVSMSGDGNTLLAVGGHILTSVPALTNLTRAIAGGQGSSMQLQYVGNNQYQILSYQNNTNSSPTIGDGSITGSKIATGAVTTMTIADGAVTDAKIIGPISGGKLGTHSHNAADISAGTIADVRLSANVDLLNTAQTVTGTKTFSAPIVSTVPTGTAPMQVASTTQVTNLNAEMVGGQKLPDLDLRYGSPSAPNPTLQQIAMLRWDQVRGGDLTETFFNFKPSALAFDGTNIWVANWTAGSLVKINPATGAFVGACYGISSPYALAFDGTSIWVTNYNGNNVVKVNPATNTILGTYTVGTYPNAIAFDGTNIWVTASNNAIKINPATGATLGTYPLGSYPSALAFDGTNIWVAGLAGGNNVVKINPASGAILNTYAVFSYAIASDGTSMWVTDLSSHVTKFNPATGAILGTYTVGNGPYAIAFDGTSIWVANRDSNNVMKLDPATGSILGTYATGNSPESLAFDGANIWVGNFVGYSLTKLANAGITIGDQAVGTAQLANNAITTTAIANGAVTDAQITGPISAAKLDLSTVVSKSGATMTGALNLPADGLAVGTTELVISAGRVGIGTATPNDQLELTGNLRLPVTTASTGIIRSGTQTLIHSYGSNNFFAGSGAGNLYTTGADNTAIGSSALYSSSTGVYNTAGGSNALYSNSKGTGNTVFGAWALAEDPSSGGNTAIGASTLFSQMFSNSFAPWYSYNTAVGYQALYSNAPTATTNGINNNAVGAYALRGNTTGSNNTAIGHQAGYTATTSNANSTGSNNTFIGYNSGPGTATQLNNATAIGANALVSANNSLVLGGTGANAVKVGIGTTSPSETLDVVGGNVRINDKQIYFRGSGDANHGVGWYSSGGFVSGNPDGPVLFGCGGGSLGTACSGNKMALNWDSSGNVHLSGTLDVGSAPTGSSNTLCISGANSGTIQRCGSSRRLKENIADLQFGLEAVKGLRPVTFTWKANGTADVGFIAEEVAAVQPVLAIYNDQGEPDGVKYGNISAVLVKAIKEQQAVIDKLTARIEQLEKRLGEK